MATIRPKVLSTSGHDELLLDADNLKLAAAPTQNDHATNKAFVDTAIAGESANRATAITAEANARSAADTTLQSNIDALDTDLQDQIDVIDIDLIDLQDQIDTNTIDISTIDGEYVRDTGDNMSGNLTIGTDKVTLNATSGNVVAAGQLQSSSVIQTNRFGTNIQLAASSADALRVGSDATGPIKLKYDGSAIFAGALEAASVDGGTY